MKPAEVRSLFLEYFRGKGHAIVPSTPVVPEGDPTLLFVNAGMNQFKDVFLGTGSRSYRRAADTQKCIRASGKHNDLEQVGADVYHHTFFEMLGNWSFGDYFKREAIEWGWDFMVGSCGLPPGRLWATVFGGDRAMKLPPDEEAEAIWRAHTGIAPERILRFPRGQNFWEMGAAGPCGPCSEIHIDLGPENCDNPAHPRDGSGCRVNGDCARFIELWNLVFIQFNRTEKGSLEQLPARHVDTGMGLERLAAVMAERERIVRGEPFAYSNYSTGLFAPIFEALHEMTGVRYAPNLEQRKLVALRVIADHVRALCVAIADGAMPDKKMRGSVLRSLLRRGARYGRQTLGIREPFLHRLVEPVVRIYDGVFPEVGQRRGHIELVIEEEEKSFARTIERGMACFTALVEKTRAAGGAGLDGREAFRLYHQDGFPRDLIAKMAAEEGLALDEEQWRAAQEEHRKASESDLTAARLDPAELCGIAPTRFVGYRETGEAGADGTEAEARLVRLVGNEALVLDRTPFYPQGGGQVGDRGAVEGKGFRFAVHDTGRIGDIVVHFGELEAADLAALPETVTARVDAAARLDTAANHTATHLLHHALRAVLGGHATQQGSLVSPDHLRFDFTHPEQVSAEELDRIEELVNEAAAGDHPVQVRVTSLDEAKRDGVTALFGEKYGERVRVISIGGFSKELCGGTHLGRTGQVGSFRIVSEGAVQSGVRRITAATRSRAARESLREKNLLLACARKLSAAPADLPEKIDALLGQVKELRKQAAAGAKAKAGDVASMARELLDGAADAGGGARLVRAGSPLALGKAEAGELADLLRREHAPCLGAIASREGGSVTVTVFASPALVQERKVDCGKALGKACEAAGRRGGGRADFAQTGWKEEEGMDAEAFVAAAAAALGGRLP